MKRFLIKCTTEWCEEDQTFSAIAEDEDELQSIAQEFAYENFNSYPQTGSGAILEELFPDVEDGEYTDEQIEEAAEHESEYYGFNIEEWEWDEKRDEEEWGWYDLIYNSLEKEWEH